MTAKQRRRFRTALNAIDELVVYSRGLETWFRDEMAYGGELLFMPFLTPLEPEWNSPEIGTPSFPPHARMASSVGVFLPFYGFDQVAAAVEMVRGKTGADVGLLLLDGGFANDQAFRNSVLVDRPWIHVLEQVPHPQIGNVMAASDVFVRAVEHESYGRSRAEAIMTGTPVVATNVGETRGILTYEFGDVDGLAAHIESTLANRTSADIKDWAKIYRAEADASLGAYIRLITGDLHA